MKSMFTHLLKKPVLLALLLPVFLTLQTIEKANAQATPVCKANFMYGCSYYESISSFSIGGYGTSSLYDNSSCGITSTSYSDHTSMIDTMQAGSSYSGTLTPNYCYEQIAAVWIDFNDDGKFDNSTELVATMYAGAASFTCISSSSFTINLPLTAKTGKHLMRVIDEGEFCCEPIDSIDPCGGELTYMSGSYSYSYPYIYYGDTRDYTVDILPPPPCSGTPTVTTTPSGSVSVCAGGNEILTGTAGIYSNLKYQWQELISGVWTNLAGDTTTSDTVKSIISSNQYRLATICTNSGDTGYSAAVTLAPGTPAYASLPYFQDFENWQNYCANSDVPDGHWINHPSVGDSSWRRNDQGSTAGWSTASSYYSAPPPYVSGSHSAVFHSIATSYPYGCCYMYSSYNENLIGNMDLYVNCSGTGDKALYFYWNCPAYPYGGTFALENADTFKVLLSTDGGLTFNQVWWGDTASQWTRVAVPIASTSATTIIRFRGNRPYNPPPGYSYSYEYFNISLDSVYVAPPCSGTPVAGNVVPGGTLSTCPGQGYNFAITGTSLAGNLKYQWKKSTDGGITWTNAGGNDTAINFNSPPLFSATEFECVVSCPLSGTSATTSPVTVNMSGFSPTYASIPYKQSFENWITRCNTYDIPDSSWANSPSYGNNSWRREDQGTSYSCWYPYSSAAPSPPSIDGNHCASIQTDYAYEDCSYSPSHLSPGNLYLLANCNISATGNKALQFYLNNPASLYGYPDDSFTVWLSTNNGASFNEIGSFAATSGWAFESIPIASNSAQTVIAFKAVYETQYSETNNMGFDLVKILPPCSGKPTAGSISNIVPCSGVNFNLGLTGTSEVAGLSFVWQLSNDGSTWSTISGDTLPIITQNITANTYYRAIVTCTNSGLSDTTATQLIKLAPFYICYCKAAAAATYVYIPPYSAVNNLSILKLPSADSILDFGHATPVDGNTINPSERIPYVGYDTLVSDIATLPIMYRDTVYQFYVTVGSANYYDYNYGTPVNLYLDLNHNGIYDPSEQIFDHRLAGSCCSGLTLAQATVTDTFRVPDTALVGITGLRVLTGYGQSDPISPCGESYFENQQIDFLVNISYRPCNGPVNAGTADITDTLQCSGYPYMLTDTTHEYHQSNISWSWQTSPDGSSWGDVAGTSMSDTFTVAAYTYPAWYRLRMICNDTHDTTYSTVAHIGTAPPYACYCYSIATGGSKYDSSDIGAFTIGKYLWDK
ncbi:MAG TPA: GEVED domain-containing protein, partial [Flavipsychrobacter sp.]|nr:GEVED domain-containing protein [Flavipsychrobacter sp.]